MRRGEKARISQKYTLTGIDIHKNNSGGVCFSLMLSHIHQREGPQQPMSIDLRRLIARIRGIDVDIARLFQFRLSGGERERDFCMGGALLFYEKCENPSGDLSMHSECVIGI